MPIRRLDDDNFEFYYSIERNNGQWSCGCPDFNQPNHREGYKCKHIKDTIKQFKLDNIKPVEESFDEETIPF